MFGTKKKQNLEELTLENCPNLSTLKGINSLFPNLKTLEAMFYCDSARMKEFLDGIQNLTKLEYISITTQAATLYTWLHIKYESKEEIKKFCEELGLLPSSNLNEVARTNEMQV